MKKIASLPRPNLRRRRTPHRDLEATVMQSAFRLETVYHVGTMRARDKEMDSWEGTALSVSEEPEAWLEIARPRTEVSLWRLDRPGAMFVDGLAVLRRPSARAAVMRWAQSKDYVRWMEGCELSTESDCGVRRWMWCDSRQDALAQRTEIGNTSARIRAAGGWRTTRKAARRAAQSWRGEAGEDFALQFYCEDHLPQVDGVWWFEALNVEALSAPRGGIFRGRVDRWTRVRETAWAREVMAPRTRRKRMSSRARLSPAFMFSEGKVSEAKNACAGG